HNESLIGFLSPSAESPRANHCVRPNLIMDKHSAFSEFLWNAINVFHGFTFPRSIAFLARAMSCFVHKRKLSTPTFWIFGAEIFFAAIHRCKVTRWMPNSSAASFVVYCFIATDM